MAIEGRHSPENESIDDVLTEIREDLQGGTLPLRVFHDEDIFDAEMDRVFGETWELIGHVSEIPEPGDYVIRYIGQDPFIFTRDENEEVQVLFNSCRHRGTRICRAEQGNTTHFRCPYHGWTYNNSGDLIGVPKKQECFPDLDVSEWGLHSAPRIGTYSDLVFASLNPSIEPLEEYLGDMKWYLDSHLQLTSGGMEVVGEPQRWRIDSNWKIGTENTAGDGYHTHITHKSAVEAGAINTDISWESGGTVRVTVADVDGHTTMYRVFTDAALDADEFSVNEFYGYPSEVTDNLNDELDDGQIDLSRRAAVSTGNVFPNFGFVHHAATNERGKPEIGFFTLWKFQPISENETEVWFWILVPSEVTQEYKERSYAVGAAWDGTAGNVGQDDIAVWKGITESAGSKFAKRENPELNYQMGLEAKSDNAPDEDWPGPGTAYSNNHDGHARTFHDTWIHIMENGA